MAEKRYSSATDSEKKEFVVTRVLDAPLELVWKAWTEPDHMAQWWGPKGFRMLTNKMDLRPGGIYHYCMRSPEGFEMWGKVVYREIMALEKIVFINSFSDEKGNITRHPMSATWPLEVLNTLTFSEHEDPPARQKDGGQAGRAGRTTITLRGGPINATEAEHKTFEAGYQSMQQGFKGTLDQLDEYLATVMKG